jgi:hypothetical protein
MPIPCARLGLVVGFTFGHKLAPASATLSLKQRCQGSRSAVRSVRANGWFDCRENFAAVGWYLHRKEAAFPAAYNVEGDAHAIGERLGVMAGLVLSQ